MILTFLSAKMSTSQGENNTTVNEELKHQMQAFTRKAPNETHMAGYYVSENTYFYINLIMTRIRKVLNRSNIELK